MAHDAWLRRPQKFGVRRGVYLGTTEQLAGPVALRQCVEHFTGAAFEVVGLQPAAEGRPPGGLRRGPSAILSSSFYFIWKINIRKNDSDE